MRFLFLTLLIPLCLGSSWLFVGNTAFAPSSLSNLELWLDCSDTSTMTLSGSDITQLNDKSGNGRNFTQATTSKAPDDIASAQNGLHGCRFDGTDDIMTGTVGSDRSAFTIAIALKSSRQRQFDTPLDSNDTSTGSITFCTGSGGNTLQAFVDDIGNFATSSGTWSASTAFTAILTYDGTTITTYVNNAGAGTGTSSSRVWKAATELGNDSGGGFFPWKDDIYEVVFYSRVLNSTERGQVHSYLVSKWGI